MRSGTRGIAGFAILSLIWGSSWIATSEIGGHCPPFRAAAIRYGVAAALLLILAIVRREPMPRGRPLRVMILLGGTMVAAPFLLLSLGGMSTSPATTAVLYSIAPIALVLASNAGRGVPAPRSAFYATLAGFGAVVLAVSGALPGTFPFSRILALAPVALAVICFTGSVAIAKRELQQASVVVSAGVQFAVTSLLLVPVSLVVERGQASQWTTSAAVSLAALSILGSAFALPLFYLLLKQGETYQAAAIQWGQVLVTLVGSALLSTQRPPLIFYLSGGAVLLCVIVLFLDNREGVLSLSPRATADEKGD